MDRDPLTEKVIGCAIDVHRILGPGLPVTAVDGNMLDDWTGKLAVSVRRGFH